MKMYLEVAMHLIDSFIVYQLSLCRFVHQKMSARSSRSIIENEIIRTFRAILNSTVIGNFNNHFIFILGIYGFFFVTSVAKMHFP